jgi:hypothetical protein
MEVFAAVGILFALAFCLLYWLLSKNRDSLPKWISTWMIWPAMFDQVGKLPAKEQDRVGKRIAIGFSVMIALIVLGYFVNGSERH